MKKPKECPKCKSTKVKHIVYGEPMAEPKDDEVLGGCIVEKEEWHCGDCRWEWGHGGRSGGMGSVFIYDASKARNDDGHYAEPEEEESAAQIENLEVGPPRRLVGMTWALMLVIYFLPSTGWAVALKVVLGLFVIIVIRAAFQPMWNRYETMGAFVAMQALLFAGLLWVPVSLPSFIFLFFIILGIYTKIKQIKHINQGMGPDLSHKKYIEEETVGNVLVEK